MTLTPTITSPKRKNNRGRKPERLYDCGKYGRLSRSQIATVAGISTKAVAIRLNGGWKGESLCAPKRSGCNRKRGVVCRSTMLVAAKLAATPNPVRAEHDCYKTGDLDTPSVVQDRNGDVTLGLCRRCGKAEAELAGPCEQPEGKGALAWAQIEEGEVVGLAFKRNENGGCTTPLYTVAPGAGVGVDEVVDRLKDRTFPNHVCPAESASVWNVALYEMAAALRQEESNGN